MGPFSQILTLVVEHKRNGGREHWGTRLPSLLDVSAHFVGEEIRKIVKVSLKCSKLGPITASKVYEDVLLKKRFGNFDKNINRNSINMKLMCQRILKQKLLDLSCT